MNRSINSRRTRRYGVRSVLHAAFETMERRQLLCGIPHELLAAPPAFDWAIEASETARLQAEAGPDGGPEATSIVWTNRGLASDGFAATFGTSAGAARAVVDAALNHWERVITSWNRADGTTTLQVNIAMGGSGFGGAGAPAGAAPADGKPRTGSFTLTTGNNSADPNDANGWYIDPNPNDHSEFGGEIINPFAGRNTGLGPDLYSVVASELTHVLGLISDKNNSGGSWNGYLLESSGFVTNTNVMDNAEGSGLYGRFWAFQGPTVDHLMTSYNSGDATNASWGNIVHSAGIRSTQLAWGGQNWQGQDDVGNAIFSSGERTIPSWPLAHVLRDAYGYSIVDPEVFDSFYANLNRSTGALTIRGGDFHETGGISNDNIVVNVDGSELVVSVNVSNDVPGSRQLSGAGNLPAWVTRFPLAEVNSIVINADAGDDSITISGLDSGMPMTINAGDGNDTIDIGGGDFDTNILSNIVVNAGAGADDLVVNDLTDGLGSDTYNITASNFEKTFVATVLSWNPSNCETFSLIGSGNNDTINLTNASSLMSYTLGGNAGTDTFNIAAGDFDSTVLGSVSVSGGSGSDTVYVNDTADTGNDTYQIAGNAFEKLSGAGTLRALSGTELMVVNGSNANNTYSVPQLSSFLDLTINAGSGADELIGFFNANFDANLFSTLTFNGGAGSDAITVNDQNGTGLVYNFDNNSLDKGGTGLLAYAACESFTLNCSHLDSTINVLSTHSSCPPTINGNNGDDALNVGGTATFLFNFGSDITFNGGGGVSDDVSITDTAFAGTGTYTLTNGHVVLPFNGADVFYNTSENLIVQGSQGDNVFHVNQNNVLAIILGLGGDDTINVGNGNFAANITADVLVAGSDGADVAYVQDASAATSDTWTIDSSEVTKTGATASMLVNFFGPTIDQVVINAGAGGSTFNVNGIGSNSTAQDLTINAGTGNDEINLAASGGSISGAIFGDVVANGQGGIDHLYVNDTADAGNDSYTSNGSTLTKSDWAHALSMLALESMTLDANGGGNILNILGAFEGTLVRGNGGIDTFDVRGSAVGTYVTVDGGAALDRVLVNSDGAGWAGVQFDNPQDLATLAVDAGGAARVNAGGSNVITTGLLDITGNGYVNLTDNAMIINYAGASPIASIQAYLTSGYAGGGWNGTGGINSTSAAATTNTAVGYAEATDLFSAFPASFEGVSVDNTAVLLKYTFYGDATLDGSVNLADFNKLAGNFGLAGKRWSHGDFNFDGTVNLLDFNKLAGQFGQSGLGPNARPASGGKVSGADDALLDDWLAMIDA
jgi:hypothetical protein